MTGVVPDICGSKEVNTNKELVKTVNAVNKEARKGGMMGEGRISTEWYKA